MGVELDDVRGGTLLEHDVAKVAVSAEDAAHFPTHAIRHLTGGGKIREEVPEETTSLRIAGDVRHPHATAENSVLAPNRLLGILQMTAIAQRAAQKNDPLPGHLDRRQSVDDNLVTATDEAVDRTVPIKDEQVLLVFGEAHHGLAGALVDLEEFDVTFEPNHCLHEERVHLPANHLDAGGLLVEVNEDEDGLRALSTREDSESPSDVNGKHARLFEESVRECWRLVPMEGDEPLADRDMWRLDATVVPGRRQTDGQLDTRDDTPGDRRKRCAIDHFQSPQKSRDAGMRLYSYFLV